jgi:hypothetical protein
MRLSEIERIAKAAMDACSEVINNPNDGFVRERLFDSLTEVVDSSFLRPTNHDEALSASSPTGLASHPTLPN